MKQQLLTCLLMTTFLGLPGIAAADAEPHSGKHGLILTGTTLAGMLLGGPVGLIAGAASGAWLSEAVTSGEQRDELATRLAAAGNHAQALEQQLARHEATVAKLQQQLADSRQATQRYQRLASDTLKFQVLFHTGEGALLAESENRLARLARYLAEQPNIGILLSGYADPRGDDQYNEQLSRQRVDSVTELLTAYGVSPDRITGRSFGATQSQAADKDYDAYALERRVTIELVLPADQSLAQAD